MSDPLQSRREQLQQQIKELETAIATFTSLPDMQTQARQQLLQKQQELAALTGEKSQAGATVVHQSGGINFGIGTSIGSIGEIIGGDKFSGDKVMGDKFSGDKVIGNKINGDQFTLSGNFSGAILNIKSTLTNVAQSIGAAAHADTATKDRLQDLVAQLSAELQKARPEWADAAAETAKRAESAVAEATKANPDKEDVEYSLSRLKKAAENIGQVLRPVPEIASQIASLLRGML